MLKVRISKLFFFSFSLTQYTAYICGSIHRGHLLAFLVRIPFWIESSSVGKPSEAHLDISTSLVKNFSSLKSSLLGICFSFRSFFQCSYIILFLKSKLNGPQ